jgi:dTDP-4-amino-4,6-dideoxygalactose transaminase
MAKLALLGGEKAAGRPFIPWPVLGDGDVAAVDDVLRSGKWFRYDGEKNDAFEAAFAGYIGAKIALAVTNGTAALEIPLAVLGIGPGDEVIVPSYTFYSTASAVLYVGATPVFCDIDPESYNLDLDKFEALITPRTKAVIPVHFAGLPVDMDRLNAIAARHDITVIEDCAHSHGAKYKGRMTGSLSKASAFSFQASKNLTSGEGGAILTDDEGLYAAMYSRHTCGRKLGRPWYEHHAVASNLRLTEMQAALLLRQLSRLEEQAERRLANGRLINAALAGRPEIRTVQREGSWSARRAWHIYMFQYDSGIVGVSRELFLEALKAEGLPAAGGYPVPLNRQPVFSQVRPPEAQRVPYSELDQPGAERCCRTTVWVPQNCLLGGPEYGKAVVDAVCKVLDNAGELRDFIVRNGKP